MPDPTSHQRRTVLAAAAAATLGAVNPAMSIPPAALTRWRHYTTSRYGQLHVVSARPTDEAKAIRPPLVCFHPSPTSGEIYHDLQMTLAAEGVVHCPDTPGYGASDGPTSKPSMADYAAGLADGIAALGYGGDHRVDLFGFHTGSLCALEVAIQRPDLVRRVVLSGVPHYDAAERDRQRRLNVPGYPYFTDPEYVGNLFKRLVLKDGDGPDRERRFARFVDRLRAGPNGWWGPDAVFTMNTGAALGRLGAPTLFIAFNEMMTEPTRAAAKLVPGSRLVEMLDLSMFGFIEAPARVAAEIAAFLT